MKLENEVPNALSETLLRKACFQNLFVLDADGTWNGPTIAFFRRNIGNPDGYQKKAVAGEAKWIVVKRRGLAKLSVEGGRELGKRFGEAKRDGTTTVTRRVGTGLR